MDIIEATKRIAKLRENELKNEDQNRDNSL